MYVHSVTKSLSEWDVEGVELHHTVFLDSYTYIFDLLGIGAINQGMGELISTGESSLAMCPLPCTTFAPCRELHSCGLW